MLFYILLQIDFYDAIDLFTCCECWKWIQSAVVPRLSNDSAAQLPKIRELRPWGRDRGRQRPWTLNNLGIAPISHSLKTTFWTPTIFQWRPLWIILMITSAKARRKPAIHLAYNRGNHFIIVYHPIYSLDRLYQNDQKSLKFDRSASFRLNRFGRSSIQWHCRRFSALLRHPYLDPFHRNNFGIAIRT